MKELLLRSNSLINDVFSMRAHSENFAVIVENKQALRLYKIVPYYRRYRDAYRKNEPGKMWRLLSFSWRGMLDPKFWGACIIADFEADDSKFIYANDILRAEFLFRENIGSQPA
jgi:hypothetical protein